MIVDTCNYGLCLFSYDKLISFLVENKKTRIKRLLDYFEKNHDFYVQSLRTGVWLPIPQINSIAYTIEIVNNEIDSIFHYEHFNLEITDDYVWVCDIGHLSSIDKNLFQDGDEIYYYTLDNTKIVSGIKIPMNNGKYLVSIFGSMKNDMPCFSFQFNSINSFEYFKDPREDEIYDFNIANYLSYEIE